MYEQPASHGNVLTFTIPGFSQQLNIRFPDSRLAVCAKCKKNFKTRDMCRVRNTHTSAPWATAYICITIDDSCLDANGKFVDKPMSVRLTAWQPYCVRNHFHTETPVCSSCKRTNRTRSFCRERHKHKQLPWCTVYVVLTTLDTSDPHAVSTVKVEQPSNEGDDDNNSSPSKGKDETSKGSHGDSKGATTNNQDEERRDTSNSQSESGTTKEDAGAKQGGERSGGYVMKSKALLLHKLSKEAFADDADDQGDDIHNIAESRTFLAKVSSRNISIHWLELADYDDGPSYGSAEARQQPQMQVPQMMPAMVPMAHFVDPGQGPSFYPSNMGYAAQLHQNALKSRQQYFFQLQQQQMQQSQSQIPSVQSPYGMPQSHWMPAPGMYPPQGASPSESNSKNSKQHASQHASHSESGGSTGPASDEGREGPYTGPPQQWTMYYHPIAVPVTQYAIPQYMGPPGMMTQSPDPDLDVQNSKKRRKR